MQQSSWPTEYKSCLPHHHISIFTQSTYIYRVQSSVWRLLNYQTTEYMYQTIDPHPLSTQRVCPPHASHAGGVHTRQGVRGGGSIFRKTPDLGLTSYSIIPLRISHIVWPAICQFSMKQLIVLSILSRTFTYNFLYKDYYTSNTHFVSLTLRLLHCFFTFRLLTRYSRWNRST